MGPTATPAAAHEWGSAPEFYGPRHSYRESLMLRRLLPTLPGPRVLNVGCGAGSLTLAMLARGLRVDSVDTSEAFVDGLASRVARDYPEVRARVEVADAASLPFPDGEMDAVTCGEVLEHLDDDAAAAREIVRVLRPGGVAVLTVPAGPGRYSWVDEWAGHRRRYTREGLAALLATAGFAEVVVEGWGLPMTALYDRYVYPRLLGKRLSGDGGATGLSAPGGAAALAARGLRGLFALDSLVAARGVGHPGLLTWCRTAAR